MRAVLIEPGCPDVSVAQDLIADLTGDPQRGDDAEVFGDSAYGTGAFQEFLEHNDITSGCKTQPIPNPAGGLFSKDHFTVDLTADTVTCPNHVIVTIRRHADGSGTAKFSAVCKTCPLRARCTASRAGRSISIHPNEAALAQARARNHDPVWRARYRTTRPKIERKLAHLMRRRHGGRNARVRGKTKVDADFNLLAAATNLARLATLGLRSTHTGWATS